MFRRHLSLAALAALVLAAGAHAQMSDAAKPKPRSKTPARKTVRMSSQLLPNGSFASGLQGWGSYNARVTLVSPGADGSQAARVAIVRGTDFSIIPNRTPVSATVGNALYTAGAQVRSRLGSELCLRVREWAGDSVVGSAKSCVSATSAWKAFPEVSYRAQGDNHQLDVYVYQLPAKAGDGFDVDAVTLGVNASTPSPPPPPPSPVTPPPPSPPAPTAISCDLYASTSGSDANSGGLDSPFRTAQKLVNNLSAGKTGCLRAGTYEESVTVRSGGSAGAPITLRSAAGERATIHGRLWIADSATDVTFDSLNLDGSGTVASPVVNGDRITFRNNDVTTHHTGTGAPATAICFILGDSNGEWGIAVAPVLDGNRIHDCGNLPADNHGHAVYVEGARDAKIVNNLIYDNADRGIQLYPDAQGTLVANNVIDGNGEGIIFSGAGGMASNDSTVTKNVISNSNIRTNVESWYPAGNPVGQRNVVRSNCVFNGAAGNFSQQGGFDAVDNLVANPLFANRAAKNFTLAAGSPCAGMGPTRPV